MHRKRISVEELSKFKYPNLIAEFIESGYSICTLGEHMGIGKEKIGHYRSEDDPEIWGKLKGEIPIYADEGMGLCKLFGAKLEYLFDSKLEIYCEAPLAYWRHYETNKKQEEEYRKNKEIQEMERQLRAKPYLIDFMKYAITLNDVELQRVIDLLKERTST